MEQRHTNFCGGLSTLIGAILFLAYLIDQTIIFKDAEETSWSEHKTLADYSDQSQSSLSHVEEDFNLAFAVTPSVHTGTILADAYDESYATVYAYLVDQDPEQLSASHQEKNELIPLSFHTCTSGELESLFYASQANQNAQL